LNKFLFTYLATLLFVNIGFSQTILPYILNSAGKTSTLLNGGTYYDNVGEPFVMQLSITNSIITQGFLQPEQSSGAGVFNVSASPIISQLTCNKNNGSINLNVTTSGAYKLSYVWTPNSVCPDSSCAALDSLKPGIYQVQVKATFSRPPKADTLVVLTTSLITILENTNPCIVNPYNAVTLNNDGKNDFFFIENIDAFPDNTLSIYNRYGVLIQAIKGYNNKDKVWPESATTNLTGGTYFYVLRLSEKENIIKGWVELIKR
jgi:gliding motility-associated-like protein